MRKLLFILPALLFMTGCPVPPTGETPVGRWYWSDPVSKATFWVYVPEKYNHKEPMKVLISCHGTPPWDIAEHHIRTWKWYGEEHGIIIICPDLTGTDGIVGDGPIPAMLSNERKILSILSTLSYRYNIDQNNIMITGFSGGGFPAYFVGLRHPELFSVVVAQNCNFSERNLDGWYPPEAKKIPLMIYYGEYDPQPIIDQSTKGIAYFKKHNFNVTTKVLRGKGHDRMPKVALQFFLDHLNPSKATFPAGKKSQHRPLTNNGGDGIFTTPSGPAPPKF